MFIRGRAANEIDAWLASEAASGRQWRCPDRSIGGYPFRIEVVCPSLALQHPRGSLSVGRVVVLAQAYDLRLVKAEIAGPLRAAEGDVVVEGAWRLAEASLRLSAAAQRFALAVDEPAFRFTGGPVENLPVSARRFEAHVRPDPQRAEAEGAYNASLSALGTVLPVLDDLVGGREAADVTADTTVTRVTDIDRGTLPERLERWRAEGGRVELGQVTLLKGGRRVEARGDLGLDELHRVQGTLQASAAGLEGLLGSITRGGLGAGVIGALTGRPRAPSPREAGPAALAALPPLRFENGRLYLGPLPVPGLRLAPLY